MGFALQFADDAMRLVRPGLRRASLAAHCCGVTPPHSPRGGLGTKFARYFRYRAGILRLKFFSFADSKSHMDRNKFYVTVSRAKSDVTILTDDIDKLHKNAQEWCHKVTSDNFIHDLEDEISENHYKTVGSDYRDEVQRAIDLQHLANVSHAIIAKRNRNKSFDELSLEHLPCLSDFKPQAETQKNDVKIEVPAKTIDTPPPVTNNSTKPIVTAPKPKPKRIEQKQKPVFSR